MAEGRVAIALSGGEDSSVAALLLKRAGYEVTGIYLRLWDSVHSWQQEYQAERVCHILDIPFHVVVLHEEFRRYVVDYFCWEYRQGRTPNPCIACNQHIKFGCLFRHALSLGVDYLATGHYARIECSSGNYFLLKAVDASKDQSYFLYTLSQEKLRHILFPLGSYTKTVVNQIARQEGLSLASRPSQDVCFISQKNYRAFLEQYFSGMPGEITDTGGRLLGQHQGVVSYTVGQRHGLGLALGRALYVVRIEPENNRVVLGGKEELYGQEVIARDLRWVGGEAPLGDGNVTARIRYRGREVAATLLSGQDCAHIWFLQPQRAIASGQAIVFYSGDRVLGGGIIDSSRPAAPHSKGGAYVTAT